MFLWIAGLSLFALTSATAAEDLRHTDLQPVEAMIDGGLREAPEIVGREMLGRTLFPVPEEAEPLDFPNPDMDNLVDGWPVGWRRPDPGRIANAASIYMERHGRAPRPAELAWQMGMPLGQYEFILSRIRPLIEPTLWQQPDPGDLVEFLEGEGPEGSNALRITNQPGSILATPHFEVRSEEPFLLSYWTRTDGGGMGVIWYDLGLDEIAIDYLAPPQTDGEWRRAGYFFRARQGAEKADVFFTAGRDTSFIDLAGVELRTATEEEYAAVYRSEREAMADNVTRPEPGDGARLTLSKAKLASRHGVPGRPFVVWAIGSSWTNGLGRGEDLRQMLREVYPDAPKIVYKVKVGSGTPYDYARGWAVTGVVADQPDLVLSYTNGTPDALEEMLYWIRSQTTADVIIPSIHFHRPEPLSQQDVDSAGYALVREICERYGAQFVENRKELAAWLEANGHADRPAVLNSDRVHQNRLGSLLTNENIWRHLVAPIAEESSITSERVVDLRAAWENGGVEGLTFAGEWAVEGDFLVSKSANASITMEFTGNRFDVVGEARPGGGHLLATVNGSPLNQLQAFATSMVRAPDSNLSHGGDYPRSSQGAVNTGPHGVLLGENVTAQNWRVEMIDDQGHYRVVGSRTGVDGVGRSTEHFVSDSGQIEIPPRLWRHATWHDGFRNQPGDHWTFTVRHAIASANGRVAFRADEPKRVDTRLFYLAPYDDYRVELKVGDGPVALQYLAAYKPPFGGEPFAPAAAE